MKILYLDCGMGAAGDMLAAALLELLPDPAGFVERLNGLGLLDVTFSLEKSVKCGIAGTHLAVSAAGQEEGASHGHSSHAHNDLHGIRHLVQEHLDLPKAGAGGHPGGVRPLGPGGEPGAWGPGGADSFSRGGDAGRSGGYYRRVPADPHLGAGADFGLAGSGGQRSGAVRPRPFAGTGSGHGGSSAGDSHLRRGDCRGALHPDPARPC